jgi:DNA polymerase III delta subunit
MAASRKAPPKITPADLVRALAKGVRAPIYVLAGPESVLRDQCLKALKRDLIDPEFESFNYRMMEPSGLHGTSFSEELHLLPMGGGSRLLVISPADGFLKDQLASLTAYAADSASTGHLVLVVGALKEGLKKAVAGAVFIDCSSPYEDKLPQLLASQAKELGVSLDRDAGAYLTALCGRDLSRASIELSKAAEQAGAGGKITRRMVEALAGGSAAADIFKISSALLRSNASDAVRATRRYLAENPYAEPRVLYELGMHLRKLLSARGNIAGGMRPQEAARAVGVFWKDAEAFAGSLREWPESRITAAFKKLLIVDRSVKTGAQEPQAAIEKYIWDAVAGLGGSPDGSQPSAGMARMRGAVPRSPVR